MVLIMMPDLKLCLFPFHVSFDRIQGLVRSYIATPSSVKPSALLFGWWGFDGEVVEER